MSERAVLQDWVIEALRSMGGKGRLIDVCKYIWRRHEGDLRNSGDLFYTWQYDVRWSAQKLRNSGKLMALDGDHSGVWQLR